jgi:hypothetical protein
VALDGNDEKVMVCGYVGRLIELRKLTDVMLMILIIVVGSLQVS